MADGGWIKANQGRSSLLVVAVRFQRAGEGGILPQVLGLQCRCARLCGLPRNRCPVAQIGNLLYRKLPVCAGAGTASSPLGCERVRQFVNPSALAASPWAQCGFP